MSINNMNKEDCCGCFACMNVCPSKSIKMIEDYEGFLYPSINLSTCKQCGLCKYVCPIQNNTVPNNSPKVLAVVNLDKNIRMESSSGGVFSMIAEAVLNDFGVVFGAAFSEDYKKVSHIMVDSVDALYKLRGSKYVQSIIGSTYRLAEKYLKEGRKVFFTGTPCQISGLKKYLRRNYENLFTADLVCHGVPSPKVWEKYCTYMEQHAGASIKSVSFRDKKSGWLDYCVKIGFDNGQSYLQNHKEDLYIKGFLSNCFLRPSCGKCKFKNISRVADFTFGDFWGIFNYSRDFDNKGVSLVLVHSEKGERILRKCSKCYAESFRQEQAIESNPSIIKASNINPLRKKFFVHLDKMDFDTLIAKYAKSQITLKTIFIYVKVLLLKVFPFLNKLR